MHLAIDLKQLSIFYYMIIILFHNKNICSLNIFREEKALLESLKTELMHKKEELNKVNERIHLLENDTNQYQRSISQLEEALEVQKSKNNVSPPFIEIKIFSYSFV